VEWISVNDRLPITEEMMGSDCFKTVDVIAYDGERVMPATFEAGNTLKFWCRFSNTGYDFTHWMPLPLGPNEQLPDGRDFHKIIQLLRSDKNVTRGTAERAAEAIEFLLAPRSRKLTKSTHERML